MKTRTLLALTLGASLPMMGQGARSTIGQEVSVPVHLEDSQEFYISTQQLIKFGEKLFTAMWTVQEGAGRPLSKGTDAPLSDPKQPLLFPRNFNRISGPDANSCSGCHNKPYIGGGGDISNNVFVMAQRFDSASFDPRDPTSTKGARDEKGTSVTLREIADSRKTVGMFGSGFIEMLARQMTADLQGIRDGLATGQTKLLSSKGIGFGALRRTNEGSWDTSKVEGLPPSSLRSTGPDDPPTLVIQPFGQAGSFVSLRQFTNNAFNQHHGIQAEERFGTGTDADGDGVVNELTTADVTAVTLFQATLPVPGRVVSKDPEIQQAVRMGEERFSKIGCSLCHVSALPLDRRGWIYREPGPYNPLGNLQPGDAPSVAVDLTSDVLPQPRLRTKGGIVWVPAFTDLKLHDITSGAADPNREPLDQNQPPGSPAFFAGNSRFLTRKLWGIANQHSFGHHGQYTTMREAVLAHAGEALSSRTAFQSLSRFEQDCVIEFLKSLQILPPNTKELVVTTTDQ